MFELKRQVDGKGQRNLKRQSPVSGSRNGLSDPTLPNGAWVPPKVDDAYTCGVEVEVAEEILRKLLIGTPAITKKIFRHIPDIDTIFTPVLKLYCKLPTNIFLCFEDVLLRNITS